MSLIPNTYVSADNAATEIWVITDIHHLSPTLYDDGEYFQHIQATAGGMDIIYSSQRLEALVMQIEEEQPDILLVSGDLSLNGEYQSMIELADVFARIERLGTQVYVIPGNHDISNGWASHFTEDTLVRVRQVLPDDFRHIFADFGYNEAVSVDDTSLSYVIKTQENLVLLMIDSNIYTHEAGDGPPTLNGVLAEATKDWLWSYLDESVSDQDIVLPVVHHNTLHHFDSVNDGYTLDNTEELQKILHYYSIPLVLSGHIHAQSIGDMVFEDKFTLTEIVTGAFAMSPSAIGKLTLEHQGSIHYDQLMLEVENWARSTNQTEDELLNYQLYMRDLFLESARELAATRLLKQANYDETIADEINKLFAEVNLAVFSGNLSTKWPLLKNEFIRLQSAVSKEDHGIFSDFILDIVKNSAGDHQQIDIRW